METNNKWAAGILGISIIFSAAVGGYSFYKVRSLDNTLSVTGSARQKIVSDTVQWTAGFSRSADAANLKSGYSQMAADAEAVKKFFKSNGVADSDVNISPVSLEQPYLYDRSAGAQQNQYILRQTVTVQSKDVNKITEMAKDVQKLVEQGVIFASQGLQYTYSKLPDLRVQLLSDAMKDAKTRAQNIAQSDGRSAGELKSASMGVVQVMSDNSQDVADYGNYDTSTVNKEVMVTVKAAFSLK